MVSDGYDGASSPIPCGIGRFRRVLCLNPNELRGKRARGARAGRSIPNQNEIPGGPVVSISKLDYWSWRNR